MKNVAFFLLTVIILNSCKKSSNNPTGITFKFDSIQRGNLTGWTNLTTPGSPTSQAFCYKYNGNKFSLRIGGFGKLSYSGGYISIFSQLISDTVIYGHGIIEVITRSSVQGLLWMSVDTTYFVMSNNKPQTQIYYDPSVRAYDTTSFYYASNDKINRTVEILGGTVYEKIYNYSSSGNLETISGRITDRYDGSLIYTTEETFGDYDSTPNPLKSYWLWGESFTRSLSENNYRSYRYSKVNARPGLGSGAVVESANLTWNFKYKNGVVDYSKW